MMSEKQYKVARGGGDETAKARTEASLPTYGGKVQASLEEVGNALLETRPTRGVGRGKAGV